MLDFNYELCTGCSACMNACPKNAISMVKNSEGFLYPSIDGDKCVNCNLCNKACPNINSNITNEKRKYYATWNLDELERQNSATGGFCATIAKYIIENGGLFCGAAFINGKLKHAITDDFNFFNKYMRGSKYFQSEIGNIYKEIKDKLVNNKVVFVGTPCQVSGLKQYLNKEYDNLLLIDLICHGVPSQKVFNKFVESNNLSRILNDDVSVNFRDKKTGWHTSSLVIKNDAHVIYDKKIHEDLYCKAFLTDICLRNSCYRCNYTSLNRCSDIMVGDYWGCPSKIDDNKGINLISVNKKGEKVLKLINKNNKILFLKKFSQKDILQPQLKHPTKKHYARNNFFKELDLKDFNKLMTDIFDKKKNVGILNFHWENNNYGAILTAYALNLFINKLGYYAYNIDFVPEWGKNSLSTSNFEDFRQKYLPMTNRCSTLKELKELNKYFENFVVGSDQVFNPELVINERNIYYLAFVDDINKRIAYSASFGTKNVNATQSNIIEIGYQLSKFNDIGVRELSGVDICKNTFRTKATQVLDPVFLLEPNEWIELANNDISIDKPIYYIVNEELESEANNNLKDCQSIRYNLTIQDWLGYIMKAPLVITDSFHALCFSLIFNKPFIYIGKDNGRQERVRSLFNLFNIPKELFILDKSISEIDFKNIKPYNYTNWNNILQTNKENSIEFLKNALEKENSNIYNPYYFAIKKLENGNKTSKFLYWKYKILYKFSIGKAHKRYKNKYQNIKLEMGK